MAYTISYSPEKNKKYPLRKVGKGRAVVIISLIVLIFTLLLLTDIPDMIADLILPGDPSVTKQAISNMVQAVKEGDSVPDAFTAFCRFVISHG